MSNATTAASPERLARIAELRRGRTRSPFLRVSVAVLAVMVAAAWWTDSPFESVLSPQQKRANLERFVQELKPAPVRDSGDWSLAIPWAKSLLVPSDAPGAVRKSPTSGKGLEAAGRTFTLSAAAITLAGLVAVLLIPLAARNLATPRPLDLPGRTGTWWWGGVRGVTRTLFVFCRSMPEFLLGFILISAFGPQHAAWAMVLALAVHNFGILGRLGAEVTENTPPAAAKTVVIHGGGRLGAYVAAILPDAFNRFIVYFFYRWETCVREATVLGMLSVMSLGYLIDDSAAKLKYDRMVFYVLLGAAIVILGDLLSDLVRRRLRRQ